MTAWAAGLRHNIRKQNRSIIPVFNTLSVLMKFKSPVIPFFGSQKWRRGIIAAWTQKTSNCCDEWTIAP
ncbi:hypothetical protein DCJ21_20345 [Salmonella enterica subsp. enterica serovar 4,12:i:-]|nr:hypothetical protein [Salmonella enterica]EBC9896948.1 hypothetical protein [Salmonella enterica subsp. enterica serovar Derby]EBS0186482.1 hypothetical protein [Salmonella enterica subsp. enterica serovar Heidelberg]ECB8990249.1 hypothetical protein [Salmonella enterica subsp. enterica serovar 4,[5],12:i:-]ECJ1129455.1 hypothetical protein [Salmonella enterica subsp. enterica serovar Putten]ECT0706071.1 hypothetical protein [Salmonella enterica subsp. enterica serovar Agona]ECU0503552.1 h